MKLIRYSQLVDSHITIELNIGSKLAHKGRKLMVEDSNGDIVTKINNKDEIRVEDKFLM